MRPGFRCLSVAACGGGSSGEEEPAQDTSTSLPEHVTKQIYTGAAGTTKPTLAS